MTHYFIFKLFLRNYC